MGIINEADTLWAAYEAAGERLSNAQAVCAAAERDLKLVYDAFIKAREAAYAAAAELLKHMKGEM